MPGLNLASGPTDEKDVYNQRLSYPSVLIGYQTPDQSNDNRYASGQQQDSKKIISSDGFNCVQEDKYSPEVRSQSSTQYGNVIHTRQNVHM